MIGLGCDKEIIHQFFIRVKRKFEKKKNFIFIFQDRKNVRDISPGHFLSLSLFLLISLAQKIILLWVLLHYPESDTHIFQ